MIPATANLRVRQTFGAVGYHQIQSVEDIARIIKAGIPQSALISSGFKQITLIEPRGTEKLVKLILFIADGKKFSVEIAQSQLFYDFNQDKIVDYTQLHPEKSGILYNTSADQRCSGTHIKLQVASIADIETIDKEIEVFELQTAVPHAKLYVDSLENAI